MWENPTGDHQTVSELDCCVNVESFSITYVTEVLPQQQAKYSSRHGDKCAPLTNPRPPPLPSLPHSSWRWRRQLSSASSPKFALTLGITDPYLVLRCLKRLNTAHGVPDTFLSPPPPRSQGLHLSRHSYLHPHHPSQRVTLQKFLNVSRPGFASHLQNATAFWAACTNRRRRGTRVGGAEPAGCIVFHRGALLRTLTFG